MDQGECLSFAKTKLSSSGGCADSKSGGVIDSHSEASFPEGLGWFALPPTRGVRGLPCSATRRGSRCRMNSPPQIVTANSGKLWSAVLACASRDLDLDMLPGNPYRKGFRALFGSNGKRSGRNGLLSRALSPNS